MSMHNEPSIQLKSVSKTYPVTFRDFAVGVFRALAGQSAGSSFPASGRAALDAVTADIRAGERVGIIGPNGAGKSTLVHIIAGLAEPTGGVVEVAGRVTAVMTLGLGLREDLSGRENIYIDGELQGKTRAEVDRVIGQIIDFAELSDFINMPVRTYSTGMKARLAFAMISCIEPEILVIDEALSAGDAFFAVKARQKIQELCSTGRIVIVVSHDIDSIRRICDRCLWMDSGRIVMDGDPVTITGCYSDHVRAQDESLLLARLPGSAKEVFLAGGIEALDLSIHYSSEREARRVVESGKDVLFSIAARAGRAVVQPSVRVALLRLDGTLLMESRRDIAFGPLAGASGFGFETAAELSPLRLNRGTYVCRVELVETGNLVAARSAAFEVTSTETFRGGYPQLLWPYIVHSERI